MKNNIRRLTTARSTDKIIKQINNELDRLGIENDHREIMVDASRNRCAMRFIMVQCIDGKEYKIVITKGCKSQSRIQDNIGAIHLWLRNRVISLERGIEIMEEAFGAHIDVKLSVLPPSFGNHLLGNGVPLLLENSNATK